MRTVTNAGQLKHAARRLGPVIALLGALLASAASAATPNPAACVDDAKLWYSYGSSTYTHQLGQTGALSNTLLGSGTGLMGDITWGADGKLYGIFFQQQAYANTTYLYTINPSNGSYTASQPLLFPAAGVSGGAYGTNGLGDSQTATC